MDSKFRLLSSANIVVFLTVIAVLWLPDRVTAGPTYEWRAFMWGWSSEDMLYGPEDNKEWAGEWKGHLGTYHFSDQTRVLEDFVWHDFGIYNADSPPGPWRYYGTVTYFTADHITITSFYWYDSGHEGESDYYHSEDIIYTQEKTWADPHALYLTNWPVPAPGALLLAGMGTGLIGWLRRRRTL